MNISLRELSNKDFNKLYTWCKKDFINKWFEQRELTKEEIYNKYQNKLLSNKQKLFIIKCNDIDIGLVQLYKYEDNINIEILNKYHNIYEFDIFIGEEDYLNKGIGTNIVNIVKDMIYPKYQADAIILRPFKNNIRAIKCYEKANFKVIGEYNDKDTIGNNVEIIVLLNTRSNIC